MPAVVQTPAQNDWPELHQFFFEEHMDIEAAWCSLQLDLLMEFIKHRKYVVDSVFYWSQWGFFMPYTSTMLYTLSAIHSLSIYVIKKPTT